VGPICDLDRVRTRLRFDHHVDHQDGGLDGEMQVITRTPTPESQCWATLRTQRRWGNTDELNGAIKCPIYSGLLGDVAIGAAGALFMLGAFALLDRLLA